MVTKHDKANWNRHFSRVIRYTQNGIPYSERKKPSLFSEDGTVIIPQYEHAGPQ